MTGPVDRHAFVRSCQWQVFGIAMHSEEAADNKL
jgi:hypothetical protein